MSTSGRALICGSIAFDSIMVFDGRFKDHILPDKIHMLNVSFLVPQLRREFGGCAGNIAYNLKLLGDVGYPMATVGRDFGLYADWMKQAAVPADHVKVIETQFTAQGFVTTDLGAGFVLVTSRASYEMVQKAAALGVTFLAALSAPTSFAIRHAQRCGLTLVAFARREQHVVYANGQRLVE